MRTREYGQFCGLARAAEMVGQRWTLLILRDLLVGPRRFSDLTAGLPGIPTNSLATRLKELEQDGLVTRETRREPDRSVVYTVTPRGAELAPALDALARWGAGGMRRPREGEIVTTASLVTALRLAADNATAADQRDLTYTVTVGDAVAQVSMRDGVVHVAPGAAASADLVITCGPELRDLLGGVIDPDTAVATETVTLDGDAALLAPFTATFSMPYSTTLADQPEADQPPTVPRADVC